MRRIDAIQCNLDLVTLCDIVTVFAETKSVTKLILHSTSSIKQKCDYRSVRSYLLFSYGTYILDTIQDFLCKLGMKPHMHLAEISIFPLNHVIVRPTKIIKDLCKAST